jgi:hypothetical protein
MFIAFAWKMLGALFEQRTNDTLEIVSGREVESMTHLHNIDYRQRHVRACTIYCRKEAEFMA